MILAIEYLYALLLGYAIPQFSKTAIFVFKHKQKFNWNDLIVTGGMPSVHSSIVVSLTTTVLLTDGMTGLFFVTLALCAIVIRDAMGVRRTAGDEGKLLNQLIKKSKINLPKLHYSLGHTPQEVMVGSLIGFLIAIGIYFIL